MAILSGIGLSKSKNKLGNLVLMNKAGVGVVAREYVAEIKNPQSNAQMVRRVKWANLVNFYRLSKGWIAKAFENKKQGQSDYNKLMSLNINLSKASLTKTQASLGAVVLQPYVVSYGSIQPVEQRYENGKGYSDLSTGDLAVTAITTIAELSSALLANNPQLRNGDQISFISYLENYVDGVPYSTCRAFEMPVDTTRRSELISDYFPDFLCSSVEDGGVQVLANSNVEAGAFTFVISRTIGGKIYVSTQSLICTPSVTRERFETADQEREAIASYGESEINFLDSNYYGKTTPAGIPLEITKVFCNGNLEEYYPNGVVEANNIEGAKLEIFFTGVEPSEVTSVRVVDSNGTSVECGINRRFESSVITNSVPEGLNDKISSVAILAGTKVLATIQFATSEGGTEQE